LLYSFIVYICNLLVAFIQDKTANRIKINSKMNRKIMLITLAVILAILGIAVGLMAYNRVLPIMFGMHKQVYQVNQVALDGYDAVSYFKDHAVKGSPNYSLEYGAVKWHFTSKENLSAFKASPERYMPQFGGYCAKAISTGFTAPADPGIYAIHDGKLFIFSSEDVKNAFLQDPAGLITACEKNWK
jgi:YHS domain-containing protein